MQIIESLEDIPSLTGPISLAIGNFDGVHPGHLYLISELKKRGLPVIITFRNHPAEILSRDKTPPLLCSLEEKLRFLESAGVELIILLPFTPEMALTTYDVFLKKIKKHLPFQTFIAGKGDTFGFQRQGTEERIKSLQSELNFEAIYLQKFTFQGKPISSTRIRELLAKGEITEAHMLLNSQKRF